MENKNTPDKQNKSEKIKSLSVSDLNVVNKILNTIPDLVFITSKKGDILYVKFDKEEELAFPADEILGKNLADLPFSNELLELFLSKTNECSETGNTLTFKYKIDLPHFSGYYEARAIPFEFDNVMVIIRNRNSEENAIQKLIESENLLINTNKALTDEKNNYQKLYEDYINANTFLSQKKQEVENLFAQNLYNERILNQVLENSPNGIFTYSPDLTVNMMNPIMLQVFTLGNDNPVGKSLLEMVEDEELIETLKSAVKGISGLWQGWYRSKRIKQQFYGHVKTFPLYDEEIQDKIIGGTAIVSNLTDWKLTSESLQEREDNLLVTLNSIGDGVIVTDENGIVKIINPVAQRLTGFPNNESISKNIDDIFQIYNSETGERNKSCVEEVLKNGNVYNMTQRNYLISVSGEKYQISVTASPIRNKENNITGVVIVFQDITDTHRMFQRILLSETRQKALVQNSPLGVLLIHENGQILDVNQSAVQLLGSPSTEATKKINVLHFEPLEKAGFKSDFLSCLKTNSQVEAERKYVTKWGKEIYVKYFFNPIVLPDTEENGILCSLVDITDQKLAEEREIIYTNSLKHLSDTAISFVELAESEDPFLIIGNKLRELSGLPYVLMKKSDESSYYEIVNYSIPEKLNELISVSGIVLTNMKVPAHIIHSRTISRYFQRVKPDFEKYLNEYLGSFSESYKNFPFEEVYTIDFIWETKDFGNATFFLPKKDSMKNIQVIETFVNQASLLLQKRETAINLRKSNDLYLTSVNAIADNFFIIDSSYKLVFINSTFQKAISNFTKSIDIIGKNIFEVFPFLGNEILEAYDKIISTKKPNAGVFSFDVGNYKMFIESNSVPIYEDNIITYIITTFRDITAQRNYENQIKELKEFNEKIIESIKDGIAVINEENEIIFTNPAFDRMLGVKHGSAVNKKWTDFVADIPIDDFSAPFLNERSSLVRTEVTLKKGSKDTMNAMITISPAVREKNTYILLVTDITERKKMEYDILKAKEKAEESDRLKTAFLSNMSHEIRTPLNSIIGFSYLLQNREIPLDKQKVYLNQINLSSQMLLRLIQDIIDISKIEAGQLSIEYSVFDLYETMNELQQHFSNEITTSKKDIKLICHNTNSSLMYRSDYIRIKQVFSNLINNSIKFTDKGLIEFGFDIENEKIKFFVKDTGIGIKKEDKALLFQRFSRIGSRFEKGSKGTGLGLAICKNIVELMGGKIEIDTVYKKGTTFTFTLPYNQITEKSDKKPVPVKHTELPSSDLTILIAEDDDINFMFIHEFLSEHNANIIRALNGEEALNYFREHQDISMILMDLQMPVMDGIESTKKIREISKTIPIIAQTAYAFSTERKACLEAGCNDYISKPIVQDELLEKIKFYTITHKKNAR